MSPQLHVTPIGGETVQAVLRFDFSIHVPIVVDLRHTLTNFDTWFMFQVYSNGKITRPLTEGDALDLISRYAPALSANYVKRLFITDVDVPALDRWLTRYAFDRVLAEVWDWLALDVPTRAPDNRVHTGTIVPLSPRGLSLTRPAKEFMLCGCEDRLLSRFSDLDGNLGCRALWRDDVHATLLSVANHLLATYPRDEVGNAVREASLLMGYMAAPRMGGGMVMGMPRAQSYAYAGIQPAEARMFELMPSAERPTEDNLAVLAALRPAPR